MLWELVLKVLTNCDDFGQTLALLENQTGHGAAGINGSVAGLQLF